VFQHGVLHPDAGGLFSLSIDGDGTGNVTPAASLYVTLTWSLSEQKPPGLSQDRQGLEAHLLLFLFLVSGSFNLSVVVTYGRLLAFQVCFWGGHVPTPNPSSMREGSSFSGDRCLAWWAYNLDGSAHQPPLVA